MRLWLCQMHFTPLPTYEAHTGRDEHITAENSNFFLSFKYSNLITTNRIDNVWQNGCSADEEEEEKQSSAIFVSARLPIYRVCNAEVIIFTSSWLLHNYVFMLCYRKFAR